MSHFALAVLCLTVHFFAMLYLGRAVLGSFVGAAFAAFLATAAGWMSNALVLANYDNLVFLALVPALVGVLVRLEAARQGFPVALSLAGGLLLAALVYTYAEGVPIIGVLLLPPGGRRTRLQRAVDAMFEHDFGGQVLPFDATAASAYAQIFAARRRAGRPIAQFDAQIAAVALCRDVSLATRNIDDFAGCGVELLNPWDDAV